jgi:hypothetical protein
VLNLISNYLNLKSTDVSYEASLENAVSLDLVTGDWFMPVSRSAEAVLSAHVARVLLYVYVTAN